MAMSPFEKRCQAVELLLSEAALCLAAGELDAAERVLRAGLSERVSGDALEVRLHALELLRERQVRLAPFEPESWRRDELDGRQTSGRARAPGLAGSVRSPLG